MSATRTVLIATHPFGEVDPAPFDVLRAAGARLVANPHRRRLKRDELEELLRGVEAVVAGTEAYDQDVIARASELKLIARVGVGLDAVDLAAARAKGVAVAWTPDAPTDSVAELAVGLAVTVARHVVRADEVIKAGRWERFTGPLLRGRTIGIVGLGRIGRRVAELFRPFGCRLLATDIDPGVAPAAAARGVELVPLEALLERSDLVTLHLPLTDLTRGLFSAERLARLRRGAFLVNTSRGEVIDEAALLAALESGRLAGAALDVFCQEPYAGPLASRPDVILTAHMGSCSDEGRKAMELGAARAVAAYLRGEAVPDRVV